jgi:DNA-binding XRE family transcriptional regulator
LGTFGLWGKLQTGIFIKMNNSTLGNEIRVRRAELGIRQAELAELAGVSTHTLSNIESGQGNPQWATVMAILEVLGLNVTLEPRQDR